jgi:hypothetical protein
VAAGDQAGRGEPDHVLLADDDSVDVLLDLAEELRGPLGGELALFGGHVGPV